jgi:transposase
MALGEVPADWRHRRLAVRATPEPSRAIPAIHFLDIEAAQTRAVLRNELGELLAYYGLSDLDVATEELARQLAPALMDEPGIGPITAGKLIALNPARFKSKAAFARANGTAPQPASSGKTIRHRLSRGGDRQINTAIYTIALSRSAHHTPSRTYIQRRINEGKTKREAIRSLKRYLSRDIYQHFSKTPLTT